MRTVLDVVTQIDTIFDGVPEYETGLIGSLFNRAFYINGSESPSPTSPRIMGGLAIVETEEQERTSLLVCDDGSCMDRLPVLEVLADPKWEEALAVKVDGQAEAIVPIAPLRLYGMYGGANAVRVYEALEAQKSALEDRFLSVIAEGGEDLARYDDEQGIVPISSHFSAQQKAVRAQIHFNSQRYPGTRLIAINSASVEDDTNCWNTIYYSDGGITETPPNNPRFVYIKRSAGDPVRFSSQGPDWAHTMTLTLTDVLRGDIALHYPLPEESGPDNQF